MTETQDYESWPIEELLVELTWLMAQTDTTQRIYDAAKATVQRFCDCDGTLDDDDLQGYITCYDQEGDKSNHPPLHHFIGIFTRDAQPNPFAMGLVWEAIEAKRGVVSERLRREFERLGGPALVAEICRDRQLLCSYRPLMRFGDWRDDWRERERRRLQNMADQNERH